MAYKNSGLVTGKNVCHNLFTSKPMRFCNKF